MEYIIITLTAISVTSIIVYKIVNTFGGVKLRLKPLILCAVCAILISIVLPRVIVGFAGLAGTLGILLISSFIFAYFVAYYDDHSDDEIAATNMNLLPQETVIIGTMYSDLSNYTIENRESAQDLHDAPEIELNLPLAIESDLCQSIDCAEAELPLEYQDDVVEHSKTEDTLIMESSPVSTAILDNVVPDNEKDLIDVDMESTLEPIQLEEPLVSSELTTIYDDNENEEPYEVSTVAPLSTNLDDLIDFAFTQKENQNYQQAYNGFFQALKLYPDTTIAPMLAIEIANILKNRGAYDEAIQILADGRSLKELEKNKILDQQFIDTIAYLRIVKNVLVEKRLGSTAFVTIPQDILFEIDKEFQDWRNLG